MSARAGMLARVRAALDLSRLVQGWRPYAVIALITLAAAIAGVFRLPALDRDESRFAQASAQMLESGDFITIRYQDEGRNKKPAGIYWLQAASTAAFSSPQAREIWSYRLPSLIGAMLAAMLTFWAGHVLIGRRAALFGASLLAATLLLTTEAHIAKTDAVLAAFTVLGLGALARLYTRPGAPHRATALLFWAAMGAGFLIKGPVTPLVGFLTLLALAVWERRAAWARPLAFWAGPVLFLAIVLPWFIWVQIATQGEFLAGAVGKDLKDKLAGASEGHGGPPGYHLAGLPVLFFPATILLLPAIVMAARSFIRRAPGEDRSGLRFLLAWLVPTWLVFEFLPTKLMHYTLPAYPALALLCGWAAGQLASGARAPVSRALSAIVFALGAGALAYAASPWGAVLLQRDPAGDFRTLSPEAVLDAWAGAANFPMKILAIGLVFALITLFLSWRRQIVTMTGAAIVSGVLIGAHVRGAFLPAQTWVQPTVTARLALGEVCALPRGNPAGCEGRIAPERVRAAGYAEPSLVFSTGTATTIPPETVIAVQDGNRIEPVTAFLLNTESPEGAAALASLTAEAARLGRCTSVSAPRPALNYSNGDPVVFVAMRIEDCPP